MRMTLSDWKAFCASLGVPYAEGEVIEATDDEALHAAVAEFGKGGGVIIPAHASAIAHDLVDDNAPTDQVTAHTPTATQPMCWRVMGRGGARPSVYLAFVDDTATLGLDVELKPSQARRIAFALLKAAATADDPPTGEIPQLVTQTNTRRIRRKPPRRRVPEYGSGVERS